MHIINSVPQDVSADEFSAFGKWVKAARIVGLGEDNHGTKEFYNLKLQLIKYLVKEEGFTLIAIEDNLPEINRLNQLLLSGRGSIEEYKKNLSKYLQFKEYFELFDWLNEYNRTASNKVSIYGMDIQSARAAIDIIADIANRTKRHPIISETAMLRNSIDSLYLYLNGGDSTFVDNSTRLHFMKKTLRLARSTARKVRSSRKDIEKTVSVDDYCTLRKNAEIVISFVKFISGINTPIFDGAVNRDMEMAENVSWTLTRHPGEKIIVWAHNGHIHKALNKGDGIGYFLRKRYGNSYFSAGFLSGQGTYSTASSKTGDIEVFDLPDLSIDSWNEFFTKRSKQAFYLRTDESFRKSFGYSLKVRGIGLQSVSKEGQYYMTRPLDVLFDCVFFIPKSTAATYISTKY